MYVYVSLYMYNNNHHWCFNFSQVEVQLPKYVLLKHSSVSNVISIILGYKGDHLNFFSDENGGSSYFTGAALQIPPAPLPHKKLMVPWESDSEHEALQQSSSL